jgi:hypothetical protein
MHVLTLGESTLLAFLKKRRFSLALLPLERGAVSEGSGVRNRCGSEVLPS